MVELGLLVMRLEEDAVAEGPELGVLVTRLEEEAVAESPGTPVLETAAFFLGGSGSSCEEVEGLNNGRLRLSSRTCTKDWRSFSKVPFLRPAFAWTRSRSTYTPWRKRSQTLTLQV